MSGSFAIVWKILAVIGLVTMNGFLVAAEFALVKIRDTQLEPLIKLGQRRAKMASHIIHNLSSYLSASQLGITIASLGLGWIGEPIFSTLLSPLLDAVGITSMEARHSISAMAGFVTITFLHIVAGELAPRWMAIQNPVPVSLWAAHPLHWFYIASYPFNRTLNKTAEWLLRRVGIEPSNEHGSTHSEEELRLMVDSAQDQAGATELGRGIVLNALDLRRRIVRDVMRPRHEITFLDTEAGIAQCLDIAERTRFSRFPLCEAGNMDKSLGVIHYKDLFAMRMKARTGRDLIPGMRKLIYVPETARLEKLLQLFLDRKLHFAIVIDEYGGTVGMATLENILEELVGQIQDEFDQEKPLLKSTGEAVWEVSGSLPLHDLSEVVGETVYAPEISTTSGWVTQQLGGFPKEGDAVKIGRFELRVETMDGRLVDRLKLTGPQTAPESETPPDKI